MASYDRDKLMRIADRKHRSNVMLNDLNSRAGDARDERNRLRNIILTSAQSHGGRLGVAVAEKLIALSSAQAQVLKREEVENFQDGDKTYSTGIEWDVWKNYVKAAAKFSRLDSERTAAKERHNAEFAIFNPLIDAVKSWGFSTADVEP